MDEEEGEELADAIVDFCRVRVPFEGRRWTWWKLPRQLRAAAATRPQAIDLEDLYRTATGATSRRALGDVEYTIRLVLAAIAAGVDERDLRAGCRTLLRLFAMDADSDERLQALEAGFDNGRRPNVDYSRAWHDLARSDRT